MRALLVTTALAATAVAIAAAGCSITANGSAIPAATNTNPADRTTSPTSSEPGPANSFGAPKVTNPLDATKFLTQPCIALTPAQLRDLNLPVQGKSDTDSAVAKHAGPACAWTNSDVANTVGVSFMTGNPNGLTDLYRTHRQSNFDYWIETKINGYPAVLHDLGDGRPSGQCNLAVGISDTLAFRVGEHGPLKEKSCDRAMQVASAVVQTLKGGG